MSRAASTVRRPYSKSYVSAKLGMKPAAALEYLKQYCPECIIEPCGRTARARFDPELFDQHLDSRRHSNLKRRQELDADWIDMKLAEEFGQ